MEIPEAAVELAVDAQIQAATKYTRSKLDQGPSEGNYDRIQRLTAADMLRASLPALREQWECELLSSKAMEAAFQAAGQKVPWERKPTPEALGQALKLGIEAAIAAAKDQP